jgi:hypothetical protein
MVQPNRVQTKLNPIPFLLRICLAGVVYLSFSFLGRIVFVFWNQSTFAQESFDSVLLACLHGLRFDLWWYLCSVCIFAMLTLLEVFVWKRARNRLSAFFLISILAVTSALFYIDTAYFAY